MADRCWYCESEAPAHEPDCKGVIPIVYDVDPDPIFAGDPEAAADFERRLREALEAEIDQAIAEQTWWERVTLRLRWWWQCCVTDPLTRWKRRRACRRGEHDPQDDEGPTTCWWCDEPMVVAEDADAQ